MEADWSVELAAGDPILEMPWSSPDGTLRYQDLRQHPERIPQIPECESYPEFAESLRTLNSPVSPVLTAKCDAFAPEKTEPAEELFGSWRMVGYIDLLLAARTNITGDRDFSPEAANFDFALHEQFARDLCARLNHNPNGERINATIELVIRRCVYKSSQRSRHSEDGFYFTVYMIGYGESAEEARQHWGFALSACSKLLWDVR